jgi:hypothetical protein
MREKQLRDESGASLVVNTSAYVPRTSSCDRSSRQSLSIPGPCSCVSWDCTLAILGSAYRKGAVKKPVISICQTARWCNVRVCGYGCRRTPEVDDKGVPYYVSPRQLG